MSKKWMPIIAGILDVLSGVFQLMAAVFFLSMSNVDVMVGRLEEIYPIIITLILFALLAVIGGIYNIRRTKWPLAITGSIAASIFLPLMLYFVIWGTVFQWLLFMLPGIIAIILTVLSKKEFG